MVSRGGGGGIAAWEGQPGECGEYIQCSADGMKRVRSGQAVS